MSCEFNSLLPDAGAAELALEQALNEKYCRLDPAIIQQLFDPEHCPIELLPWLAFALSVDVWNDGWPESVKRQVCSNALAMHRHKGTLAGVEEALAALGIKAEIVEWWQMEPRGEPMTMSVTLWLQDNILPEAAVLVGPELINDVLTQLERSKRASIHYTFKLGIETDSSGAQIGYSGQLLTRLDADAQHTNTHTHSQPATGGMAYSSQMSALQRIAAVFNSTRTHTRSANSGMAWSAQLSALLRIEATV
jgi:phage tail P2-like protein